MKPQIYNLEQPVCFNNKKYFVPEGYEISVCYEEEKDNNFVATIDAAHFGNDTFHEHYYSKSKSEIEKIANYIVFCLIGFIESGLIGKYFPKITLENVHNT